MTGSQSDERAVLARMIRTMQSAQSYTAATLPPAEDRKNEVVYVADNPQGYARSEITPEAGWRWLSEVDGSDLGPGS